MKKIIQANETKKKEGKREEKGTREKNEKNKKWAKIMNKELESDAETKSRM